VDAWGAARGLARSTATPAPLASIQRFHRSAGSASCGLRGLVGLRGLQQNPKAASGLPWTACALRAQLRQLERSGKQIAVLDQRLQRPHPCRDHLSTDPLKCQHTATSCGRSVEHWRSPHVCRPSRMTRAPRARHPTSCARLQRTRIHAALVCASECSVARPCARAAFSPPRQLDAQLEQPSGPLLSATPRPLQIDSRHNTVGDLEDLRVVRRKTGDRTYKN